MKPSRLAGRLGLVLFWASLATGCAFKAAEPALMYRLVVAPMAAMEPARAGRFELMPLRSNRPQGGSLGIMVAEVGEVVRVEEFAAGRWEESPETVIERALAGALSVPVESAERRPRDDAESVLSRPRLRASLEQFEMVEPRGAAEAYVAVALGFQLVSPRDRLVLQRGEIQERQPLSADAALDDVVLAFNRASSRAVSRFVEAVTGAR